MTTAGDQEVDVMFGLRNVLSKIQAAVARRSKVSYFYNSSAILLICLLNNSISDLGTGQGYL